MALMKNKNFLIISLLTLAALVRFVYPLSDPPFEHNMFNYTSTGELFTFEGDAWSQDARNKALFDHWVLDKWPTSLFMPLHNLASYASFKLFGVGIWQVRLPSMLMGFITVLMIYLVVKKTDNFKTGFLAAFFVGFNYLTVMLNRTALIESGLIFTMTLAYASWVYGFTNRIGFIGFGVLAVLSAIYKPTGIVIVIIGLIISLTIYLRMKDYRPGMFFLVGVFIAGIVYLFLFHSHLKEIFTFYSIIGMAWSPKNIFEFLVSTATVFVSRYFFFRQPVLSVFSILWVVFFFSWLVKEWVVKIGTKSGEDEINITGKLSFREFLDKTSFSDYYVICWFLIGLFMPWLEGGQSPMLRRYMFLIPPMAILSAKTMIMVMNKESKFFINHRLLTLLLFICGYIICFSLLRIRFYSYVEQFKGNYLKEFLIIFLSSICIGVIFIALKPLWIKVGRYLWQNPVIFPYTLLGLYIMMELGQFGHWVKNRQYTIYDSNKRVAEIEELQHPVVMAGSTLTTTSSFLSKYKTMVIGSPPKYMNWENILDSEDIQYYLLNEEPYKEDNPILMPFLERFPNSIPLAQVQIGKRKATIYKKVKD